jgi:hypothetical protein
VSGWSEVFLGVIAVATLATAIIQIGVLVAAGLLARRMARLVSQVEVEMKPIFAHLDTIGRDATRATSLATAQVERVDRLFADVGQRVEEGLTAFQASLSIPVNEARAVLTGLRAAFSVLRDRQGARRRRPRGEDEDALFI